MLLERMYDDDLAQASYLIGCQASGEMLVVDPLRDPGRYLDAARSKGMRIVAVTETHVHADYLSGSVELAGAANARLYLSGEGGDDWQYAIESERLADGAAIRLGNVTITAVHTPGHTPEHLSFLITDGAAASEPGYLLTGDFVFVGDVGRPDLLDEAAGASDTRFDGADRLFASLRDRFLTLPDYVQVLPGHGAGSACGKALGAVPSTTVGYERRFSWWAPYVLRGDAKGFSKELLEGQPDAPSYFGRMKRQNLQGPAPLGERRQLQRLEPEEMARRLSQGARLIDTRSAQRYVADGIKGALHVPAGGRFTTYASYALDPELDPGPIYLLATDAEAAAGLSRKLALIGVDDVRGFVSSLDGLERRPLATVTPQQLPSLSDAFVLDVRGRSEFEAGHIPGASRVHLGRLRTNLSRIPGDRPIVVHCQSGGRAAVAASMLLAAGFENVVDLEGSYGGWESAQERTVTK
ncbi:MAG: MBL fold metallo-hydrolase [Trueperaceae bacterium]